MSAESGTSGDVDDVAPREDAEAVVADASTRIYQAMADEDWTGALDLAETHWGVLSAHRLHVIRALADALPDELLTQRPRWATVRRFVAHVLVGRRVRPTAYSRSVLRERRGTKLDRFTELVEDSIAARSRGDFDTASASVVEACRLAKDSELSELPGHLMLPTLFFQAGMSAELADREDLAIEAFQRAYGGTSITGDMRTAANAAAELSLMHGLAGRRRLADLWMDRHEAIMSVAPKIAMLRSTAHLARASALHDALRFDEAQAELELTDSDSWAEHWPEVVVHRIMFDAFARRRGMWELLSSLDAAAAEYSALAAGGLGRKSFDFARVAVLALGGQPERALPIIEAGAETLGVNFCISRRAAIHYVLGDVEAAARDADIALSALRAWPRIAAEALIVKAAVHWHRGESLEAAETFRQAVGLAVENRMYVALAIIPRDDVIALTELTFGEIGCPEPLQQVIDLPRLFPPPMAPVEKLTAQEQRVLAALAGGETLAHAAARLSISENTVKVHVRSIYRKLGVGDRVAMVAEAARRGLI